MNFGASSRTLIRRVLPVLLLPLALAACGQDQAGQTQSPPPPPVETTSVSLADVDVHEEYAGRIRGSRAVQVRARIGGILKQRMYTEGAYVEAGAKLFRIDPEPYGVALARAEAERQHAQANLQQARRDWERVSRLYEDDAISTRQRDQALSALELARADLAVAESAVDAAQIELGYTTVEAPVAGVTSLEVLPEGSLATRGDLLTTVTQLDPVHVRFSLPERDALAQRHARQAMTGADTNGSREAFLLLPSGERYERSGQIDFTEAGIDPATGTVRARAVFPNPDRLLTPGMFVRVRLRTATLESVAVIPERALTTAADGPAVFVIGEDGKAASRTVELGPIVPNGQVIKSGLNDGDRVVVTGVGQLSDGTKVSTGDGEGGR